MFYDTDKSLWYMVVYWTVVTVVFGVSLLLALKLASIELERAEKIAVILVSSLVALIPVIGPYLAFIVAIVMIYRMSDSNLGMVIGAVIVTRFIAIFVAIFALQGLQAIGLLHE
jgi:asparagine N-glycosylation enzyme membrane subunit Stt3